MQLAICGDGWHAVGKLHGDIAGRGYRRAGKMLDRRIGYGRYWNILFGRHDTHELLRLTRPVCHDLLLQCCLRLCHMRGKIIVLEALLRRWGGLWRSIFKVVVIRHALLNELLLIVHGGLRRGTELLWRQSRYLWHEWPTLLGVVFANARLSTDVTRGRLPWIDCTRMFRA